MKMKKLGSGLNPGMCLRAATMGLLAVALVSCGGSTSNPKATTVEKLKPALDLQALPGDGQITLTWLANNNESSFSGYNIYMATDPAVVTALGLKVPDANDPQRFSPVAFQDSDGNDITTVRPTLAKYFNWDSTQKAIVASTDGKTFSPLARCNVASQTSTTCTDITDSSPNVNTPANGRISYTVPSTVVKNGTPYYFFVTSTMSSGKTVVSPTTTVVAVSPRKVLTLPSSLTAPTGSGPYDAVDLEETGAMTAGSFTKMTFTTDNSSTYCKSTNTDTSANEGKVKVYFQTLSSGSSTITGANGTRIADLGPVSEKSDGSFSTSGLLESPFRMNGTALAPVDSDASPSANAPMATDVGVATGYSACGESVLLSPSHLYSIAYVPTAGGAVRYALLETGTTPTSPGGWRVVVANASERRL